MSMSGFDGGGATRPALMSSIRCNCSAHASAAFSLSLALYPGCDGLGRTVPAEMPIVVRGVSFSSERSADIAHCPCANGSPWLVHEPTISPSSSTISVVRLLEEPYGIRRSDLSRSSSSSMILNDGYLAAKPSTLRPRDGLRTAIKSQPIIW